MNLYEIIEKYIDEPIRQRQKVPGTTRLKYRLVSQSYRKYILVGLSLPLILLLLYALNILEKSYLMYIVFWFIVTLMYYQYDRRTCSVCRQKMIRQSVEDTLYYFCDSCKTKIDTHLGTDGG